MLDILKRRLSASVGAYEWNGETVHFRRLSAGSWVAIQALTAQVAGEPKADEETKADEEPKVEDPAKAISFYVELIAITLCDSQGLAECDSDEGRKILRQLSMADLQSLGSLSLKHSGLGGDSKN